MAENNTDNNINIPIERTDLVLFQDAVSSVKEKFIAEMKRMDEEMNKLRPDASTLHAEMASASENDKQSSKGQSNWESLTSSPLVEGEGKDKTLKLQFDVSQFDPTEVTVKIQDQLLVVSAAHEERSDSSSVLQQFYREFQFPKGVDPATITSTLSKDGVLTVEGPLPQLTVSDISGRCSPKSQDSK